MVKAMTNNLNTKSDSKKQLTMFGFFTLTASMLMSSDEYAVFAESGLESVFFLVVCGLLWFLPVALCSAEMATVEGQTDGGVYAWVGNSLGRRFGFLAIFFQWFQVNINFITMIYFIIGSISYALSIPAINDNPMLKLIVFLLIYWGTTLFQLKGIGKTTLLVKWCFILGIIIPSVAHVLLAVYYIASGGTIEFDTNPSSIIPDIDDFSSLVVVLPFVLAYSGIEASASHINEMRNPKRDYHVVLILLVAIAVLFDSIGGLSIATVISPEKLSMNTGVVQGMEVMVAAVSPAIVWIVRVFAILMAIGMLGEISAWIIGPVRGLYVTSKVGIFPKYFDNLNKDGVPFRLVMLQGIFVSIIATLITLLGGSGNSAFKLAISMTVMAYLVTYILMFISYIILVSKHPDKKRGFEIKGGKAVKYIVSGIGLLSSILILALSFVPNTSSNATNTGAYAMILLIGFILILALPNIIYEISDKKSHKFLSEISLISHTKHHHINKWVSPKGRGEFVWDRLPHPPM